jgi:transcriptional regulator with XRE-family HTH domain
MKLTIEEKRALGRALTAQRNGRNLTQEELEGRSGVPLRTIQRAEAGDGISPVSLAAVAGALQTTAEVLIGVARASQSPAPDLRLKLPHVRDGNELVDHLLRRRGNLEIGPEGEHDFNEHIGHLILEVKQVLDDPDSSTKIRKAARDQADYLVRFAEHVGFRLFAGHYRAELEHHGKKIPKPTTLIVAAPMADRRIHKTPKGLVLDYVVDRRRNVLQRALNGELTTYDWMEDQLISKSYGEARVRTELLRIHREIITGGGAPRPTKK